MALDNTQPMFPQIWAILNDPNWAAQMAQHMPPPAAPGSQAAATGAGGQGVQAPALQPPTAPLPQFPAPQVPTPPAGVSPSSPSATPPAPAAAPLPVPGANPLQNPQMMALLAQMVMNPNRGAPPPHPLAAGVSGAKTVPGQFNFGLPAGGQLPPTLGAVLRGGV